MDTTERWKLPLLIAGQTQKEIFHNEALLALDMLLGGTIEGPASGLPPSDPVAGRFYLVADGATGAWIGQDGMLAGYSAGGWRFVAPADGLRLTERTSGVEWCRRAGAWERGQVRAEGLLVEGLTVVGPRRPAIAEPAGGSTIDSEARSTIAAILSALRGHGLIET